MKVLVLINGEYEFTNTKEIVYPFEVEVDVSKVDDYLVEISKDELGFDEKPCNGDSPCWILGSEAVVLKGDK